MRLRAAFAITAAAAGLLAASKEFTSLANAIPVLDAQRENLPPELRHPDEVRWRQWAARQDKDIRERLRQGDLDSMVNLLLFGTSFTARPRIRVESLTEASKAGILRARVDDLVAGVRNPKSNERLLFLRRLLRDQGIDAAGDPQAAGKFVLNNLLRVLEERKALAHRAEGKPVPPQEDPVSLLDRSSFFDNRGVSLDTGIIPDFTIEQTLRDLKRRGLVREGAVQRVAVIGPGLDFIDKNEDSAYDYYPEQTLQPFAVFDSLVRLKLAKAEALSVSIFDISPRVLEHVRRARDRARKNLGYDLQLPRDVGRPWPPDLLSYWESFGDQVGSAISPIPAPSVFPDLPTRAVRIRPQVVLACEPADLDIVV